MKYPKVPYEVARVAKIYNLLQIGLTWQDIHNVPCGELDKLLMLHKEIKLYEESQMKKTKNKKR